MAQKGQKPHQHLMESSGPEDDELMKQQIRSPAYQVLVDNNMLENKYRITSLTQIPRIKANSTPFMNCCANLMCMPVCCSVFEVPDGYIRAADDGNGSYSFYGKGLHWVKSIFVRVHDKNTPFTDAEILHGNLSVVTVDQGFVGFAMDRGQPVLLSPGMHYVNSETFRYQKAIDLSKAVINLGPYDLVTVNEGYAAVSQNNGRQVILEGGKVHLLSHRNHKFEKFIPQKIQTDDLNNMLAISADNVLLETVATVNWIIHDVMLVARMAAQTMNADGSSIRGEDITKIRHDVLKQATASLAAHIAGSRFSDSFGVSVQNVATEDDKMPRTEPEVDFGNSPLFNFSRLRSAVSHANEVCNKYGVTVMSINIISAKPKDDKLMTQLAAGAVAAAAAEQAETAARGYAAARMIEAKAQADSERICALGSKEAADTLEQSNLAVELARISKAGDAMTDKTTFFFGGSPQELPALLANPAIVKTQ